MSVGTPYLLLDEPVSVLTPAIATSFYRLLLERYAEKPSTIVISTHLIEEISSLVEEVVMIDHGKVLRTASRDDLLAEGCSVSGTASAVDAYLAGCKLLGEDTLGGLKTAYLLGKPPMPVPEGIEIGGLDLQRLFVKMTDAPEGERKMKLKQSLSLYAPRLSWSVDDLLFDYALHHGAVAVWRIEYESASVRQ